MIAAAEHVVTRHVHVWFAVARIDFARANSQLERLGRKCVLGNAEASEIDGSHLVSVAAFQQHLWLSIHRLVNDPEAAPLNGSLRKKVQVERFARRNIVVALVQESAVLASISIALQVETHFAAGWIDGKQLKRDDGENDALVVVGDQLAPAVLIGIGECGAWEVGGAKSAPLVQVDHIAAHAVYSIFFQEVKQFFI